MPIIRLAVSSGELRKHYVTTKRKVLYRYQESRRVKRRRFLSHGGARHAECCLKSSSCLPCGISSCYSCERFGVPYLVFRPTRFESAQMYVIATFLYSRPLLDRIDEPNEALDYSSASAGSSSTGDENSEQHGEVRDACFI